jgi:hypothetical protein
LPNLAFIGGGGETALLAAIERSFSEFRRTVSGAGAAKFVFNCRGKVAGKAEKIGLTTGELFQAENDLMKSLVAKHSAQSVSLNGTLEKAEALYEQMRAQAESIDQTLSQYVLAMKARSLKRCRCWKRKCCGPKSGNMPISSGRSPLSKQCFSQTTGCRKGWRISVDFMPSGARILWRSCSFIRQH